MSRTIKSIVIVFILTISKIYGQDFKIYYFASKYYKETNSLLQKDGLEPAVMITKANIDPDGDEKINRDLVTKFISARFAGTNSEGMCVIDWETKSFKNLQGSRKGANNFRVAEEEFIGLVNHIKKLRPNIKVGVYGIPFRGYYANQRSVNLDGKFDRLLSSCDFIAPSYYLMYADSQVGHNSNINYLKENLAIALDYSDRLKLPIIPFMWHKIHSSNKKYANKLIDDKVFASYIAYIKSFQKEGKNVRGIFWWDWDPVRPSANVKSQSTISRNTSNRDLRSEENQDETMLRYVKKVLTTIK